MANGHFGHPTCTGKTHPKWVVFSVHPTVMCRMISGIRWAPPKTTYHFYSTRNSTCNFKYALHLDLCLGFFKFLWFWVFFGVSGSLMVLAFRYSIVQCFSPELKLCDSLIMNASKISLVLPSNGFNDPLQFSISFLLCMFCRTLPITPVTEPMNSYTNQHSKHAFQLEIELIVLIISTMITEWDLCLS